MGPTYTRQGESWLSYADPLDRPYCESQRSSPDRKLHCRRMSAIVSSPIAAPNNATSNGSEPIRRLYVSGKDAAFA